MNTLKCTHFHIQIQSLRFNAQVYEVRAKYLKEITMLFIPGYLHSTPQHFVRKILAVAIHLMARDRGRIRQG